MNVNALHLRKSTEKPISRVISLFRAFSRRPRRQINHLITALTLLLTPCFCAVGMLSAHATVYSVDSKGVKLLSRSQKNMLVTSEWWEKVWDSMLTGEGNSFSNQALYQFLMPFLLVLLLLFLARAGFDYFKGDFTRGFNRSVIPIVILSIFLFTYGLGAKAVAYTTRQMMVKGTDLVLRGQLVDIQFKEATEDQLYSLEFQQNFSARSKHCRQLPAPTLKAPKKSQASSEDTVTPLESRTNDSISCMEALLADVRTQRQEIKNACPTCKTAEEVTKRAEQGLLGRLIIAGQLFIGELGSPHLNSFEAAISEELDVGDDLLMQYWFVSGQEFMLFLAAYLAPVFILYAALPLPGRTGIPITYFSAFLVIALIRLAYVLLVGLGAAFLSHNPPNDGAEYWAKWLGVYAPLIASAGVTGGVIAAVHAWGGAMISTLAVGVSLVSSGIGSTINSLQQRDYRNR
ncbi:hypothetical protein [Acaryochloris sp. CCMEE 5410]|uniref:hypothetical protein n=1 Tax=Acaryochloris sp. CCMEE 5410 TaxID=310037 RepID=UPI001F406068|nr:hypothetical protein [Acaryochloris sp. CCMEE 5410]